MMKGLTLFPKFRIIKNFETGKFELEKRRFLVSWKFLTSGETAEELETLYKVAHLKGKHEVVKEFD